MKKLILMLLVLSGGVMNVSAFSSITVAGSNSTIFGTTWATNVTANDLAHVSGTLYRKTYSSLALTKGTFDYKFVADHAWDQTGQYPVSGNLTATIPYTGTYDVVFEYDSNEAVKGSCTLTLKSASVTLVYSNDNGSTWTVGDALTYDGVNKKWSVDIEATSNQKFACTTETGLSKGDSYSSWTSAVKPVVGSGDYELYFEHMEGTLKTDGTSSWHFAETGSATYTLTIDLWNTSFVLDAVKTITVSALGWATFSLGSEGNDRGYTISGADAFFIAGTNEGKAVLTSIASGKKIPTYPDGIMLKKIGGGDVTITTQKESNITLTDNMLQGSGRKTDWLLNNSGYTGYYLANGASGLGFYPANTGNMSPYKAFLRIPDGYPLAHDFFSLEEDYVTAINAIKSEQIANVEYYNLAGQRIAQPMKGLYIVNGKKVIIK